MADAARKSTIGGIPETKSVHNLRQSAQSAIPARPGVTESRQQERAQAREVQEQLLQEIEALKGNQAALARPGTASAELAKVRQERDALKIENQALMKQINNQNE